MKSKICGICRMEDVDAVNAAKPDYIGFVFAKSRRRVSVKEAKAMRESLLPSMQAVGVFVDAPQEEIASAVHSGIIDLVQLHGCEDGAYIRGLKKTVRVPIIKAVRVQSTEQILRAASLYCDYLLLDTYRQGVAGGTGQPFDWALIPKLEKPWFLAGGLTMENLAQACRLPAYCLDFSSGVETDGRKDPSKIAQAVERIRRQP